MFKVSSKILEENTMNLESSKTLGGIGAILLFVGVFPFLNYFGIIDLIGAILILVGLHGVGEHYHDPRIFRNAIYGIVIGIVGAVIAVVVALTVVLSNVVSILQQVYPGWDGNWATLQSMTPDPNAFTSGNFDPNQFIPLIIGAIAILAIVWIFSIIAAFFLRRSLKQVSEKTTIGLFATSGLLLLIGAFLTIVFLGFILMWIAALLLAIAFFQIKHTEPVPPPVTSPPPPTTSI
jgi:uncharacterized membrane protein